MANVTALSNPHIAAADALGNVYIADKASHAILKITPDGRIHTFAGTHSAGFNGDGPAPATSLQIYSPNGIYVFPDGTVYLLDPGNHRIRRVAVDGTMTTIVNDPDPQWYPSGRALWVSPDEQLIYYTNEYAPAFPGGPAQGAVVKKWTAAAGIELVCNKDVGFTNPGNLDVNPADGKLYVCDRAEDDTSGAATGLFRIDGVNQRTRVTGNSSQPVAANGQLALNSFIEGVRGVAFLPNGAYFVCGHRDGNIWYVDTGGVLHRVIQGIGKKDSYTLPNGAHPPIIGVNYIAQPRAVTVAPDGNLIGVSNDSGFVFVIRSVAPPRLPADLHVVTRDAAGLRLAWTAESGRSYVVERTPSLDLPSWQVIGAVGAAANGSVQFLDPVPQTLTQAFYRLSIGFLHRAEAASGNWVVHEKTCAKQRSSTSAQRPALARKRVTSAVNRCTSAD